MPEFKGNVGSANEDFDVVVDPMVLLASVPPMAVFELELGKWDTGKVGLDFTDGAAGWMSIPGQYGGWMVGS